MAAQREVSIKPGGSPRPRYRRLAELGASAFKIFVELVGAIAALLAILQAFRMWP
jgi:hypothetical protein